MSLFEPIYRARLYDRDGTTILTPASGAPHSDAFQVATASGISGYQPHLFLPRGRRGRLDFLSRRVDTGELTIEILDAALTPGSNAQRWASAFTGGTDGRDRLAGLKLVLEESLDAGATFASYFTGNVQRAETVLNRLTLTLRDRGEDIQKLRIFEGPPHSNASYAFMGNVFPNAFTTGQAYANFPTLAVPTATAQDGSLNGLEFTAKLNAGQTLAQLLLGPGLASYIGDVALAGGLSGVISRFFTPRPVTARGSLRAIIKHTSGALSGQTGYYDVLAVTPAATFDANMQAVATVLMVRCSVLLTAFGTADTGATNYKAAPADGVTLELRMVPNDAPSADRPLYINDTDFLTLWQDMLDGYFSLLDRDGATLFSIPYDGAAFTALASTVPLISVRYINRGREKLADWITQQCQALNLGWYINADNQVVPVDCRTPASLAGIGTITDEDLALEVGAPRRLHDRATRVARVEASYIREQNGWSGIYSPSAAAAWLYGKIAPMDLRETRIPYIAWDPELPELGDNPITLQTDGFRAAPGEMLGQVGREEAIRRQLRRLAEDLRTPFATGGIPIELTCRRTTNTTDWQVGGLKLLALSYLQDPQSNTRGGTRLVRLVSRTEDGPVLRFEAIDLAENTVATAPTIGTPAQETGNTKAGITVTVTLNASSEPAMVDIAVTTTATGTRPTDNDTAWIHGARVTATGAVTIRGLPSNRRIWVRVRTEAGQTTRPRMPSAWAYPAGTGYVDTAGLTAPSGAAASAITGKSAVVSWTVGEALMRVRVYLGSTLIATLPAGSSTYTLTGLTPSTAYTAYVEHWDQVSGAVSSQASAGFSTTATPTVAPALLDIMILQGSGQQAGLQNPKRAGLDAEETGIEIGVTAADRTLGTEWERAPDNGSGAPDTGSTVNLGTMDAGIWKFRDHLALGSGIKHYRARHVGAAYDPSPWSSWVGCAPIALLSAPETPRDDETARHLGTLSTEDAVVDDGVTLQAGVTQSDGVQTRVLTKGHQTFSGRDGDSVTFNPVFQNPPANVLRGGISYEPRSGQWSPSFDSAKPQYQIRDLLDLTASGATIRAKLLQKGAQTGQLDDFPTSNALITVGATAEANLDPAGAASDQYTIRYDVSVTVRCDYDTHAASVTVAIDTNDGSGWVERAAYTYTGSLDGGSPPLIECGGDQTFTWTAEAKTLVVSGLGLNDDIRLRIKGTTGGSDLISFSVHGHDGVSEATHGVTYNTATDATASMTPDAEDRVEGDVFAVA